MSEVSVSLDSLRSLSLVCSICPFFLFICILCIFLKNENIFLQNHSAIKRNISGNLTMIQYYHLAHGLCSDFINYPSNFHHNYFFSPWVNISLRIMPFIRLLVFSVSGWNSSSNLLCVLDLDVLEDNRSGIL